MQTAKTGQQHDFYKETCPLLFFTIGRMNPYELKTAMETCIIAHFYLWDGFSSAWALWHQRISIILKHHGEVSVLSCGRLSKYLFYWSNWHQPKGSMSAWQVQSVLEACPVPLNALREEFVSCRRTKKWVDMYRSSNSFRNFSRARSISPSTSSLVRLKFSMLKAYTVTSWMSRCLHQRNVWGTSGVKWRHPHGHVHEEESFEHQRTLTSASLLKPCMWPFRHSMFCLRAKRRLPSMMNATCFGMGPAWEEQCRGGQTVLINQQLLNSEAEALSVNKITSDCRVFNV